MQRLWYHPPERADNPSKTFQLLIYLAHNSARMQRTSATCYFAYNDAAVHANARNHPGDDIKGDPSLPPSTPSLSFVPEAMSVCRGNLSPSWKGTEKSGEKERKKNTYESSTFPRDSSGEKIDLAYRVTESIIFVPLPPPLPGKITSETPSLTRRRPFKCENRHRNWARYYR